MATGDMRNNLRKLQKQVSLIRYPDELDYEGLTKGHVSSHLPLLYFAFFDFSPRVVENISKMEYNLSGKRDAAFMNVVFKLMREKGSKFSLNLKVAQFMSKGFAERKIILTTDILIFVRTCPELGAGKPLIRSQSSAAMAALVGSCAAEEEVGDACEMKPDITLNSKRTLCTKHLANIVAPKMQSTSRSTLRNVSLSQVPNSLCSTIRNATDSIHTAHDDERPEAEILSYGMSKDNGVENSGQNHKDDNEETVSELKNSLHNIQQKQALLESENTKLRSDLEAVQMENAEVKKEIEKLQFQQPLMGLTNIIARLDIIESKLLVMESTVKAANNVSQSPVCGHNLCSQMNELRLQENSFVDVTQGTGDSNDKSLLDVTNESPIRSRHQRMKLLGLVQGTRTLLGMGDISDFQDVENVNYTECA